MSRVLVTYVGGNDPWGRPDATGMLTEGPILSILEHLNEKGKLPDRVLLLTTKTHRHKVLLKDGTEQYYEQGGMEGQATQLQREIQNRYSSKVKLIPCDLEVNPADLDEIIPAILEVLKGKINLSDEVHVNITSGTQAMSAAMMFLLDSGYLQYKGVWQSLDPTKLPSNAIRVKAVSLGYLTERDRLERAVNLLKAMAFSQAGSAFREISRMSFIQERRPKAQALASLMEVYQLWDRAEFDNALTQFQKTKKTLQSTEINLWDRLPYLNEQLQTLEKICKDLDRGKKQYGKPGETETILEDIYAALVRRHRSGNYLNVTTKARRLYEGILNYLIYKAALNPREAWRKQSSGHLSKDIRKRIETVWASQLRELKDKAAIVQILVDGKVIGLSGEGFTNLKQQYAKFDRARNMSYDEHGLLAVSRAVGDRTVSAAANMLGCLLSKSIRELNGHPFGVNALDELAEAIKKSI